MCKAIRSVVVVYRRRRTFKSNGSYTQPKSSLNGTWTCKNDYVVMLWSHGYIDRLTLSRDGTHLGSTQDRQANHPHAPPSEKIPFDVAMHRTIYFSLALPEDHKEGRKVLHDAVAEALRPDFEADNPITHARGRKEFDEHAAPEMKVLADEIATLRAKVAGAVSNSSVALALASRAVTPPVTGFGLFGRPPDPLASTLKANPKIGRAEALRRSMLSMIDTGKDYEAHPISGAITGSRLKLPPSPLLFRY
jgi:hypothetical protein